MSSQLIMCSLPVKEADMDSTKNFYETLLGLEMARTPIAQPAFPVWAARAVKLKIHKAWYDGEGPLVYYLVDNLDEMMANLRESGGQVLKSNEKIKLDKKSLALMKEHHSEIWGNSGQVSDHLAEWAVVKDPGGNSVVIMEMSPWASQEFFDGALTTFNVREQGSSVASGLKYINA